MNIGSVSSDYLSNSIKQMNDMLKNASDQTMAMDKKLMKVSVSEQIENSSLGNKIDISA